MANNDDFTYSIIKESFDSRKPLGDAIHNKIMAKFRGYLVVGGMPQAVEAFVNGETYEQIDFVKRNILSLYQEDLAKYDDENHEKASVVFKTIPEQLENKYHINCKYKYYTYSSKKHIVYINTKRYICKSCYMKICNHTPYHTYACFYAV